MTSPRSSLRSSLESGRTTVTAEVGPPRGADPDAVRRKVEPLRGWVDAVNITDGQGAHARLSNWAGSILALAAGEARAAGTVAKPAGCSGRGDSGAGRPAGCVVSRF